MRYFAELSYNGTHYHGWQKQPGQLSIQECIEEALSLLLRNKISITGCGRTDSGVHATQYFLHFDTEKELPENILFRVNQVLPADIAFRKFFKVSNDNHARYDAVKRTYKYRIQGFKDPFNQKSVFYFPRISAIDKKLLYASAKLLLSYNQFYPFCKSNTDVNHYECTILKSSWTIDVESGKMEYEISANRFLRGMVRLIVGMNLNAALGKLSLLEVEKALELQQRLDKSLSVPPHGLYLVEVSYPFID